MTRASITEVISSSVAENALCWCDGRRLRSIRARQAELTSACAGCGGRRHETAILHGRTRSLGPVIRLYEVQGKVRWSHSDQARARGDAVRSWHLHADSLVRAGPRAVPAAMSVDSSQGARHLDAGRRGARSRRREGASGGDLRGDGQVHSEGARETAVERLAHSRSSFAGTEDLQTQNLAALRMYPSFSSVRPCNSSSSIRPSRTRTPNTIGSTE